MDKMERWELKTGNEIGRQTTITAERNSQIFYIRDQPNCS